MNILFLDDDPKRVSRFIKFIPTAKIRNTASQIISLIQSTEQTDLLFLDHDLGGEIYVDPRRKDCGMEVVRFLIKNKDEFVPKISKIIVHTHNDKVIRQMTTSLRKVGYNVEQIFFGELNQYRISELVKEVEDINA